VRKRQKLAEQTQKNLERKRKKCSNEQCTNELIDSDGLLSFSEFFKHKEHVDGLTSRCKKCITQKTSARLCAHYKKNKSNLKYKLHELDKKLRYTYGISLEEYKKLIKQQNNKCAVCGTDITYVEGENRKGYVDHNHTTKKVRGIVCTTCNVALGYFYVDSERTRLLEQAIKYIQNEVLK